MQGGIAMPKATGDVVETPTQRMPFKAIIKLDGEIVNEEFFPNRDRSARRMVGCSRYAACDVKIRVVECGSQEVAS